MYDPMWVEVAWVCVTQTNNATQSQLDADVIRLVKKGMMRFKCHLRVLWGTKMYNEEGEPNPHAHLIVLCASDEVHRFENLYTVGNCFGAVRLDRLPLRA